MRGGRVAKVMAWVMLAGAGLAACGGAGGGGGGGAAPPRSEFVGVWGSDTLPGVASVPRLAVLEIQADSQAALAIEFVGRGIVHHPGRWLSRGSELTFQPLDRNREASALPLVWRLDGERLVPLRWDKGLFGDAGLPLRLGGRRPAASGPAAPQAQPGAAPQPADSGREGGP